MGEWRYETIIFIHFHTETQEMIEAKGRLNHVSYKLWILLFKPYLSVCEKKL